MPTLAGLLGLLTVFCAAAKGAYDLWASLAFVLATLALFAGSAIRAAWKDEGWRLCAWAPTAAAAAGFAASLISPLNPAESWTVVPSWIAAALVFPLACRAFQTEADFDRFLRLLVPFFSLQAALVAREQLSSVPLFFDQSAGLLFDANASAAFCVAWIPPLAARALRGRGETGRWPGYWSAGLIAALIAFAGAKSVWGFIALAAPLPWLLGPRFGRREKSFVVVAAAAAAVWKFGGSSDRLGWWATGLRMFADAPWTGVGLGGYASAFLAYRVGGGVQTVSAHGAPVQLLAETGMLGTGALAWALLAAGRGRLRAAIAGRRGAAFGLLALGVFSLASVCFEFPVNLLSFSLLAGAAFGAVPEPTRPLPKAAAVMIAAACLAVSPFLIAPWQASRAVVSGQEALIRNDHGEAERYFSAAGAMDRRSFEARRGLARVLFRRGDAGAAVRVQREAIARNPLNGVLWLELGAYLSALGRESESAKALGRAEVLSAGLLQRNMSSMPKSP
ncbi:MAG: hypothetical protein AUJ52_06320 [Elusimicrobia bacterium CG1_02_63_36]|nr:MAG: hypothetical protein AUJ52_06320 [Elusimicrobia bacterium CG1_02_63_36]PIP81853.1 MAG: hypothetical protein COR54_17985 [Elusimicrobia bacterium CG22_combo_CG10-13_8_21_14_all_63_91]PJA17551.1 MAG: hypothetical protein COX66_04075 [Elusimicrobia bacterium CG_4_10_14_0_2_um_filter_63_34]PJB26292.1 MAG: hypothetical protein CO113_04260 [Elusimicrobia bacterium CG_4_9_14_3_um_filter_62_55]